MREGDPILFSRYPQKMTTVVMASPEILNLSHCG